MSLRINPLPNNKFLDVTKLKAFADDKLKVAKMAFFLFDKARNTVGKRENAVYQHYLLSPQHFPKLSSLGSLTLSQTTNFRLLQIERVCRWQFQIWRKWQKVIQMGRKHCGKKRNCSLRAISPFPTVFSKDLCCRHVKTRACLGKG